jgi:hypothetical protein
MDKGNPVHPPLNESGGIKLHYPSFIFFICMSKPEAPRSLSCLEPVAQLEPNFDGIVIGCSSSKIRSAVTLSHQDGHHSAIALLLKAALITTQ